MHLRSKPKTRVTDLASFSDNLDLLEGIIILSKASLGASRVSGQACEGALIEGATASREAGSGGGGYCSQGLRSRPGKHGILAICANAPPCQKVISRSICCLMKATSQIAQMGSTGSRPGGEGTADLEQTASPLRSVVPAGKS
jgi:hypothetical protein